MRAIVAAAVLAACGKTDPAPAPATTTVAALTCEPLPFAASVPVAEASGAALIAQGLIVVGDSGNHGEYVIVDPETGAVREHGHLSMQPGISDDIEGIASPDGRTVWGLVSDGILLQWTHTDHGFDLTSWTLIGERDKNYEGLCLDPRPASARAGACDGYAASKADGRLYCLRGAAIDPATPPIAVVGRDRLADCAYSADGAILLAGGNVLAADRVWRIDQKSGEVTELAILGPGNAEVVVAGPGGVVYRFSDLNVAPSLAGKYRCAALTR